MNNIELFHSKPEEKSVFTAERLIRERMRFRKTDFKFPRYCLLGYFPSLYPKIKTSFKTDILESINRTHPYLLFEKSGFRLAFVYPGIGAPISGAVLEETIALGAENILFFGTAGAIQEHILPNELIIPSTAVRDEGTSFHYQKTGRFTYADSSMVQSIRDVFQENDIPFHKGPTWTTDALFREIPSKIRRLQKEGCLTVDMEASALFAIAKYHGKKIGGFFSLVDSIADFTWTPMKSIGNKKTWKPVQLLNMAIEILIHSAK